MMILLKWYFIINMVMAVGIILGWDSVSKDIPSLDNVRDSRGDKMTKVIMFVNFALFGVLFIVLAVLDWVTRLIRGY